MTKMPKYLLWVGAVAALPVVGYVAAHGFFLAYPISEHVTVVRALILSAVIFLILLAVPYWMMKMGMHAAHEIDPRQKELELKDIPKDQDQLRRS